MKILIVEDEADIRENLALLLRMEGHEPIEAGNGVMGQFRTLRLGSCEKRLSRAYLNSVPYLTAIALICSRVSSFGGSPGGLQVSRMLVSKGLSD